VSAEIRIVLFLGAVFTLLYFAQHIRKGRMQIDYAVYWVVFSAALLFFSIFPGVAVWVADLLHVQSPVNLVFLVISFVLILKLFTTTQKISKLNQQVTELTQHIALLEKDELQKK
jgi:hypothetical protein